MNYFWCNYNFSNELIHLFKLNFSFETISNRFVFRRFYNYFLFIRLTFAYFSYLIRTLTSHITCPIISLFKFHIKRKFKLALLNFFMKLRINLNLCLCSRKKRECVHVWKYLIISLNKFFYSSKRNKLYKKKIEHIFNPSAVWAFLSSTCSLVNRIDKRRKTK